MNTSFFRPWALFALACLLLFPTVALPAEGGAGFLQGNMVLEFVADRSRMIQVSIVVVALGCSLLFWRK
jgi:hypothetical protein